MYEKHNFKKWPLLSIQQYDRLINKPEIKKMIQEAEKKKFKS
jgi:hypothetical protein